MARFPAKYAPRAIPKIGAARPKIGAPVWPTVRPAIPTATAIATPSASARQSIRGLVPCRSMRRAYRPKRNRSARPTRIGGIAKGAGLKRRRRHHVVATTTTYFFFFELFFLDDFFFAGISGSPPPGPALWGYIHTRVAQCHTSSGHD